jgi:hypothetical protein
LPVGRTPQFAEIAVLAASPTDEYAPYGWRLETFIADEVLRCREGRLFERHDDADLYALLYERDYPIASMIMISIESSRRIGKANSSVKAMLVAAVCTTSSRSTARGS